MLEVTQHIEVFGGTISVFYEHQFMVANDGVVIETFFFPTVSIKTL